MISEKSLYDRVEIYNDDGEFCNKPRSGKKLRYSMFMEYFSHFCVLLNTTELQIFIVICQTSVTSGNVFTHNEVSRDSIIRMTNRSRSSITSTINKLVRKGFMVKDGVRGVYIVNPYIFVKYHGERESIYTSHNKEEFLNAFIKMSNKREELLSGLS